MVAATEDFDAVDRIIVVLVVKKYALFYGNLFGGIAYIDNAEQVVGHI